MARHAEPPRDNEAITDISQRVYEMSLGAADVKSMLEKDGDGGVKLRNRSKVRNATTVMYLKVLGLPIPRLPAEQTEMNGTEIKGLFG